MVVKAKRRALFTNVHTTLYEGPEPGTVVSYFKDDIALSKKTLTILGKGVLNNRISSFIHEGLGSITLPTAYLTMTNMREQVMLETLPLPFSTIVRNIMSGPRAESLNMAMDMPLHSPMVEFSTLEEKPAYLGAESLESLNWTTKEELYSIKTISLRVNDYLTGLFYAANFQLVDFTINFGHLYRESYDDPSLLIACQFTPETCTLIDMEGKLSYPLNAYYKSELRKKISNQNLLKPYEMLVKRLSLHKGMKK